MNNNFLRACSSKEVEQPDAPFSRDAREDSGSTPDTHIFKTPRSARRFWSHHAREGVKEE